MIEVRYKGQLIDIKDIEVTWTDCFGELHTDNIEDYASSYANEEIGRVEAGESW